MVVSLLSSLIFRLSSVTYLPWATLSSFDLSGVKQVLSKDASSNRTSFVSVHLLCLRLAWLLLPSGQTLLPPSTVRVPILEVGRIWGLGKTLISLNNWLTVFVMFSTWLMPRSLVMLSSSWTPCTKKLLLQTFSWTTQIGQLSELWLLSFPVASIMACTCWSCFCWRSITVFDFSVSILLTAFLQSSTLLEENFSNF